MKILQFHTQHVFFADDNEEDQLFIQEVVRELPYVVHLTIAKNGAQTMDTLNQLTKLPDLLFLNVNIAIKNGLECLQEIKRSEKLKSLPVIIFSSSSYPSVINEAYEAGAHLYIRKPSDLSNFKKIMEHVLSINWRRNFSPPPKEEFVLTMPP